MHTIQHTGHNIIIMIHWHIDYICPWAVIVLKNVLMIVYCRFGQLHCSSNQHKFYIISAPTPGAIKEGYNVTPAQCTELCIQYHVYFNVNCNLGLMQRQKDQSGKQNFSEGFGRNNLRIYRGVGWFCKQHPNLQVLVMWILSSGLAP